MSVMACLSATNLRVLCSSQYNNGTAHKLGCCTGVLEYNNRVNKGRHCLRAATMVLPPIAASALVNADANQCLALGRRELLQAAMAAGLLGFQAATPAPAVAAETALLDRFAAAGDVTAPSIPFFGRAAVLEYPKWLFGEWHVTSHFTAFSAPLGNSFVDPALLRAAQAPEEQGGVGSSVSYDVRFYSTLPDTFDNQIRVQLGQLPRDAIVQDRAFNTKAQTEAYAGYAAVASVVYDAYLAPDRETVVFRRDGPGGRPLPPKSMELYINHTSAQAVIPAATFDEGEFDDALHSAAIATTAAAAPSERFFTDELNRQVTLAIGEVDVTDYEVLSEFRQTDDPAVVVGQQRTFIYLDPRAPKFFQASSHAVAVYDHEFQMHRALPPLDAINASTCVLTPKGYTQCQ